jgi:hypothetical protein
VPKIRNNYVANFYYLCDMETVFFYEKDHSYWHGDIRLVSGTSFVGMYDEPFDRDYWLQRGALKKLIGEKQLREIKKEWQAMGRSVYSKAYLDHLLHMCDVEDFVDTCKALSKEWDDNTEIACNKGTAYHLVREKESYRRGYEINPYDNQKYKVYQKPKCSAGDNCSLSDNLYTLPDGFYPELLVFTLHHKGNPIMLCGQADKVFIGTDERGRFVDIDDYKTNNKIKRFAFKNEDTGRPTTFKDPISHLHSHHINKYGLQVSLYGWMLEQHGFRVRNTGFTHINELIRVPYMKSEIESMVKDYSTKL